MMVGKPRRADIRADQRRRYKQNKHEGDLLTPRRRVMGRVRGSARALQHPPTEARTPGEQRTDDDADVERRHEATAKARSHKGRRHEATRERDEACLWVHPESIRFKDKRLATLSGKSGVGRFQSGSVGLISMSWFCFGESGFTGAGGWWGRLCSRWRLLSRGCQFLLQSQRLCSRAASPSLWHILSAAA